MTNHPRFPPTQMFSSDEWFSGLNPGKFWRKRGIVHLILRVDREKEEYHEINENN